MRDIKERLLEVSDKRPHVRNAIFGACEYIASLEHQVSVDADHIANLESENTALRVSLEAAVLHAQKCWARSMQSTDQQNVSIKP